MMPQLRILVVEDRERQNARICAVLRRIKPEDLAALGLTDPDIRQAFSVAGAVRELREAARMRLPFHVMILDMELPLHDQEDEGEREHGLKVLRLARRTHAVQVALILSIYGDRELISKAFCGGVSDYRTKAEMPYDEMPAWVMEWVPRALAEQSHSILAERIRNLAARAEGVLAYALNRDFESVLDCVDRNAAELEHQICERQGLDPELDADDPLLTVLRQLRADAQGAVESWKEKTGQMLASEKNTEQRVPLREAFAVTYSQVAVCFSNHGAALRGEITEDRAVSTFGHDVIFVLRELLLGPLVQLAQMKGILEEDPALTVEVRQGSSESHIRLVLADNLPPLEATLAGLINQGSSVPSGSGFGREWGLAVAQHVAQRGGGNLVVEPCTEGSGNRVEYEIPLPAGGSIG